ncbi:SET domain-containing protein SmydA-8-like isoform X2 [Thrips palmi]|nr:SET domain-containing protein SmydA-8-like isoform X2 [Thrips palmi]
MSHLNPPPQCSKCGLPACGRQCSESWDHQAECREFQRAKYKVPVAALATKFLFPRAVAILRTTLAIPDNPLLQHLQRKLGSLNTPFKAAMNIECNFVLQYLRRTVGVRLSEADLRMGALITSLYSADMQGVTGRTQISQTYFSGLYVGMSLRKHSCFPNTGEKLLSPETYEYVVVTTRDVVAGEHLTDPVRFCEWYDETLQRRRVVAGQWGLDCDCVRCRDPTELGMYVGSPCCANCSGNGKKCLVVPDDDKHRRWSCTGCGAQMTVAQVEAVSQGARNRLEQLMQKDSSPDSLLSFVAEQLYPRGPLHPTHAVVLRAREYIRESFKRRGRANQRDMERWEEVTRAQLQALDRLMPGTNRHRVTTLVELRWLVLSRLRTAEKNLASQHSEDLVRYVTTWKDGVRELNKAIGDVLFSKRDKDSLAKDPFGDFILNKRV